jgi:hypothetical protein
MINASAPLDIALSSLRALSAGTNKSERMRDKLLRPHAHKSLAAALGDELVILVIGTVMKFDDASARPRFRFALADHFGRAMHGVTFE